jgi:hypothetical protein
MAKLPGRRAPHLAALLLVLLAPAGPALALDLVGTWHVLVHYTDANTSRPDQLRWDDRVWVFERTGSRLEWTEYPIVVFDDETGRFERRASGQYARVLGAWEPSEAQLADIGSGLKINTRGSKTKSLRGSDAGGWSTNGRARPASASVITYEENWSIQGLPDLPVFVHEDVMGSARSETMEGAARWETREVDAEGSLRGSYERDGTRRGSFVMRRSGPVGQLEEKTQAEIQVQGFRRGLQSSALARQEARSALDAILAEQGVRLSPEQTDAIVTRAIELYVSGSEGEPLREEIARMVAEAAAGGGAGGAEDGAQGAGSSGAQGAGSGGAQP